MNAPTPRPPSEGLETRVSVLEEKVDAQHHELALSRQHIDNSLAQMELRLRNEIHASVHTSEQRLLDLFTSRSDAIQKRQEEQFRWLFGMLVVIFISNSATILTFVNLLQNR